MRFLAELLDADGHVSHQHFIERLGKSFDLGDSIKISAVHEQRFESAETESATRIAEIKDEFGRVRAAIVSSAVQSFQPDASGTRTRFPEAHTGKTLEDIMAVEPYLAFYTAQQRNVDFRIRDLHALTRDAIADLSPQLAQLAALDTVLAGPLSVPARRSFARVPRLLGRRFATLQDEYNRDSPEISNAEPATARDRWEHTLRQFRVEMQGLLLAEIETRLLPTLGLIKALDELEEHDDD